VLDLFSRRVIGWSMSDTMPQELTTAALQLAITNRRPAPGLLHHSDRGSHTRLMPIAGCSPKPACSAP